MGEMVSAHLFANHTAKCSGDHCEEALGTTTVLTNGQ